MDESITAEARVTDVAEITSTTIPDEAKDSQGVAVTEEIHAAPEENKFQKAIAAWRSA